MTLLIVTLQNHTSIYYQHCSVTYCAFFYSVKKKQTAIRDYSDLYNLFSLLCDLNCVTDYCFTN